MSIAQQLDQIIEDLQAAKADALKVDAGKVGEPGTRVRKAAQGAKGALDALRKDVLEARKK